MLAQTLRAVQSAELLKLRSTAVDLLDEVNILATEPVPDTELMKGLVEGFLHRLEAEIGKKKGTAGGEQEQG